MDIYDRIYNALEERLRDHQTAAYSYREEGKMSEALSSISKAVECQEIMILVNEFQKEKLRAALRDSYAALIKEWEA